MKDLVCKYTQCLMVMALTCNVMRGLPPQGSYSHPTEKIPVPFSHPVSDGFEALYLMSDRSTYISGEHVWLSAFNIITGSQASPFSRVAYADIINSQNMHIAGCRIILNEDRQGSGMLSLPDTLSSGDYLLRGYTRAMLPGNASFFFTKKIRVFNPYNYSPVYSSISLKGGKEPSVSCFAEGGTFIAGIENRIAIKTTDSEGNGCSRKVRIKNDNGAFIDSVTTNERGLASVLITPEKGKDYFAETCDDGVKLKTMLPEADDSGMTLMVTEEGEKNTKVLIRQHGMTSMKAVVIVVSPGKNSFVSRVTVQAQPAEVLIPGESLSEGISGLFVTDMSGRIMAGRLIYTPGKKREGYGVPDIAFETQSDSISISTVMTGKYRPMVISMTPEDNTHETDPAVWMQLMPWVSSVTMLDPFMAPYMCGETPVDNTLLLTLADERGTLFLSEDTSPGATEYSGITVTGEAKEKNTLRPAAGERLFLNIPGKSCFMQYSITDSLGKFSFILPFLTGSHELVISPENDERKLSVSISEPFAENSVELMRTIIPVSSQADSSVIRMSMNSQVMRIYGVDIPDTISTASQSRLANHFYGNSAKRIVLSDFLPLPNMEEVFFELADNVDLIKSRRGYYFRMFDSSTGDEIKNAPLMLIDGVMTTDPATIAEMSPESTEYIDIVMKPYHLGDLIFPAIVSITTRRGDYRFQKLAGNSIRVYYRFTDPLMAPGSGKKERPASFPRYDNTLMWKIKPDVAIRIQKPDYPGNVRITVMGFDPDNRLFRIKKVISFR